MFQFDRLLEAQNLTTAYVLITLIGVCLAVVAMQVSWNEAVSRGIDPPSAMNLRRLSFVLIALAMLWSLNYAEQKGWQPWPPLLAIVAALDLYFAVLIGLILRKSRAAWHEAPGLQRHGTVDH